MPVNCVGLRSELFYTSVAYPSSGASYSCIDTLYVLMFPHDKQARWIRLCRRGEKENIYDEKFEIKKTYHDL